MNEALKKQVSDWREACKFVDDLVKSCPPLTDMDTLHAWFQEVHGWVSYIGTETARAEAYYAIEYSRILDTGGISDDAYRVIKGSSTLTDRYVAGKSPELYEIWQRLRNMGRNLETILSDMRTNIVTLREADKRDAMQAPSQT